MSSVKKSKRFTVPQFVERKAKGQKISMVTCYDSSFAGIVESSDIDVALVGDSLGNVMLGLDTTMQVTMDHIVLFSKAVSQVLSRPLLISDMPFLSYRISTEQALLNAGRLIQEGNAQAVKLEGGVEIVDRVEKIVSAGIPVMGHLGLTPQSLHKLGGYKVQGRSPQTAEDILAGARALEEAGVFGIVLEMIPEPLAQEVTAMVSVPTIGIGAGRHTDGQVLVLQDLLGFNPEFRPRFVKRYTDMHKIVGDALNQYHRDIGEGFFPSQEQTFEK